MVFSDDRIALLEERTTAVEAASNTVVVVTRVRSALNLAEVPRALVNRDTRGAVKLVADAGTGRVLGVHALAEGAGEMRLAAIYAIKAGMSVDDIADSWAAVPRYAESLRITARLFRDDQPLPALPDNRRRAAIWAGGNAPSVRA